MFTVTEFRLIREKCPNAMAELLKKLDITVPNWREGDEFKISAELDTNITNKLSRLMKSDSVIDGYMELLTFGKVAFDYSETDVDLLDKVIKNQNVIMKGVTESTRTIKLHQATRQQSPPSRRSTRRVVRKEISSAPLLAGGIVLAVGIGALAMSKTTVGVLALLLGSTGVVAGIKGHNIIHEEVVDMPTPTRVSDSEPISTSITFTDEEIRRVFDALSWVNKIIKSI